MSKRPAPKEPFSKSSKLKSVPNDSKQTQRRNKLYNSRQIRTSNSDPSFKEGILDVPSFLKSREFEIQQLEKAQLRSKYSAATRCFQSLPRVLRRRTASHNVKRVPKRMRKRAKREMKINHDANNATELNKKTRIKGKELYKLKLSKKLLQIAARLKLNKFGTDESHSLADYNLRNKIKSITRKIQESQKAKLEESLLTCTEEEAKVIKAKIHLNNIMGSYDNLGLNSLLPKPRVGTKYQKRQKKFVWMPTHIWHTKRAHLTKRWGFQIPLKPTQKCFRSTHRKSISDGGLIGDTSFMGSIILLSRVSADINSLLKKITNGNFKNRLNNKVWNGFVFIENEAGINKIAGKVNILMIQTQDSETKIMVRLHPSFYEEFFQYLLTLKTDSITVQDCRYCLGSIDLLGPMALSAITQVISPTDIGQNREAGSLILKLSTMQDLNSMTTGSIMSIFVDDPRLVTKPIRSNPNKFKFDPIDLIIDINKGKAINVESLESILSFEGRLKSYENQPTIKQLSSRRSQLLPGVNKLKKLAIDPSVPILIIKKDSLTYSLILPWYWVLPFWIQLNKISHLSIAGLKQFHQLNFENGELNYPNDYPFLTNGYIENFVNGNEKFKKWSSIQPGKKINYTKLDLENGDEIFGKGELGFPFNCDWKFLQLLRFGLKHLQHESNENRKPKFDVSNWNNDFKRDLVNLNDVYEFIKDSIALDKEKLSHGELLLTNPVELYTHESDSSKLKIAPINLSLLNKGHPKDNARIYSIPKSELHSWLKINTNKKANGKTDYNNDLKCPHANHLIGFITSATFNLSKGHGTGIGFIDLDFINDRYVLIRNVGESKAIIAQFTVINN